MVALGPGGPKPIIYTHFDSFGFYAEFQDGRWQPSWISQNPQWWQHATTLEIDAWP